MIEFLDNGDILNSNTEAIINTVNCFGVMGKGIALQIKNKYPECFLKYKKLCFQKEIKIGSIFIYNTGKEIPKYILNFPSKIDWRNDSKIEYIIDGLVALRNIILEYDIKSVCIPPLGCGNGNLKWNDVKPLIVEVCNTLPEVKFLIFNPL